MNTLRAFRQRKPTQYDVARQAGVSQTTVSLVMNNPETPDVPLETRERVFEAVRTLGYVPNSTARMLRTSRTNTLACIIPMITNPFYPAFASGVQEVADGCGYDVITYNTHSNPEKEARFLLSVQQGRVDGVIGVFFYVRAKDLRSLIDKGIPVVRLEVRHHSTREWPLDNIYVDNERAAFTATTYLIDNGHQNIAMLTGPDGPRNARRDGFLKALATRLPGFTPLIQEAENFKETDGYQGMQAILRCPNCPDAIFAANDLMAIGGMKAIHDAGLRVPEDIAMMGFDDIPAAQMVTPTLTTIHQFQEEMGRQAAEMLIERLKGKASPDGRSVEIPFELVIRDSA